MLSINTNLSSLIAQKSMSSATNKLDQAIERMTTGFKVNHAKDNAANYSISTNMTTKIGAFSVAEDNAMMGLDLLDTAIGNLDLISDKLQRLRVLAEQAGNGTYGTQSLDAINKEANALVDEIERIYNTVEYNGIDLMKGSVTSTEESKFIKDIDRRDTSLLTELSELENDKRIEAGTYSITTAAELAQLAEMTNKGLIGANTEFVLGADIDLSGYQSGEGWVPIGFEESDDSPAFEATFDGNGFVVTGLKIDTTKSIVSLFGSIIGATVKNLGVEGVNIKGQEHVSGIVASVLDNSVVENCYVTGELNGVKGVGGIFGYLRGSVVSDCYSEVSVIADNSSGVFGGQIMSNRGVESTIDNCFSNGNINASHHQIGGFIGVLYHDITVKNSYSLSGVKGGNNTGSFVGRCYSSTIDNCYSQGEMIAGTTKGLWGEKDEHTIVNNANKLDIADTKPFIIDNSSNICYRDTSMSLQIGINSEDTSRLNFDTGYRVDGITSLRGIGLTSTDYLSYIDKFLNGLSEKLTALGAVQNRLESVLDEIMIQHDNLIASRSTIRDADIAEVSSIYIQQQILQQASATLLSTANQTPSIALQLI